MCVYVWCVYVWCVYACLFFIEPTGHSLKSLDMVAIKELHNKVVMKEGVCMCVVCACVV